MIFRRFAVLAVAGVLALNPIMGRALGEAAQPIAGTTCGVGNETLEYDPAVAAWAASSTIGCGNPYPQLALSVSVVLVQAGGNSLAMQPSGIFCLDCPSIQNRISSTGPYLAQGLYQVRSSAMVRVPSQVWINAEHFSCYFVRDFTATLLVAGCPKIR